MNTPLPLDAAALDRIESGELGVGPSIGDRLITQSRAALTLAARVAELEAHLGEANKLRTACNCICGFSIAYRQPITVDELRRVRALMIEHDAECSENPMRPRIVELETALQAWHDADSEGENPSDDGARWDGLRDLARSLTKAALPARVNEAKRATANRADAGPFGKWEIEPAVTSEHDLTYTNDDSDAFDIGMKVLERLFDDIEPGETRTLRITLNAEVKP